MTGSSATHEVWARGAMRRGLLILTASLTLSVGGSAGGAPISARDALTSLKTLHGALATGLDLFPYDLRLLLKLGRTLDQYGRYEDADPIFERALAADEDRDDFATGA